MNFTMAIDSPCWYAIHTHPKQENRAESNLQAWNVKTFLPRIQEARFNEFTGKSTYTIKSLFPGYLFARFAVNSQLQKIRYTRGVHSIVCIGDTPASIDDQVIEIIAAQRDSEGFIKIGDVLRPGGRVLIQAGPFRGLTGIFERETKDTDRIKILLDAVSYQVHIEVERSLVRPTSMTP
jgi:transcriptional antiterminator RfaH